MKKVRYIGLGTLLVLAVVVGLGQATERRRLIPEKQEGEFLFPPEQDRGWVFFEQKERDLVRAAPGEETVKAWNRDDYQLVAIYFHGEEAPCYYWIYDTVFGRTLTGRVDADKDGNFEYMVEGVGDFDLEPVYAGWGLRDGATSPGTAESRLAVKGVMLKGQAGPVLDFLMASRKCGDDPGDGSEMVVRVACRVLNLRQAANTGSAVVAKLRQGELLRVLVAEKGWYQVVNRHCDQGWVASYLTEKTDVP